MKRILMAIAGLCLATSATAQTPSGPAPAASTITSISTGAAATGQAVTPPATATNATTGGQQGGGALSPPNLAVPMLGAVAPGQDCVTTCGLDCDHDGYCRADGLLSGLADCNDADAKVHPGAEEIVADGIDQDCNRGDLVPPAYAVNFCPDITSAWCIQGMLEEVSACKPAAHCYLNLNTGLAQTDPGTYFVDRNCDGAREVIGQTEYSAFLDQMRGFLRDPNWNPPADGKCKSTQRDCLRKHGKLGKRGGGKGHGSAGAWTSKFKKLEGDVGSLRSNVTDLQTQVGANEKEIDKLNDGMADVTILIGQQHQQLGELRANDSLQDARIGQLEVDQQVLDRNVGTIYNRQAAQEAVVKKLADAVFDMQLDMGVRVGWQKGLLNNAGDLVRESFVATPNFGVSVGALLYGEHRLQAVVDFGLPIEDGDAGFAVSAGAKYQYLLGRRHFLGPVVVFFHSDSDGDVTAPEAVADGLLVGLNWTWVVTDPEAAIAFVLGLQADIGYEWVGTRLRDPDTGAEVPHTSEGVAGGAKVLLGARF